MLINIFIISVVLYLFQSTYRPFLIPCYSIIHCIVFNFVITIVVLIFISKYLYHSFAMLLLLSLFLLNDRMWYGKTRVTSYELRVTSWKLKSTIWNSKARVQIHELRVPNHELRDGIHELRDQIHKLGVQIHKLRLQNHELPVQIHKSLNQ